MSSNFHLLFYVLFWSTIVMRPLATTGMTICMIERGPNFHFFIDHWPLLVLFSYIYHFPFFLFWPLSVFFTLITFRCVMASSAPSCHCSTRHCHSLSLLLLLLLLLLFPYHHYQSYKIITHSHHHDHLWRAGKTTRSKSTPLQPGSPERFLFKIFSLKNAFFLFLTRICWQLYSRAL